MADVIRTSNEQDINTALAWLEGPWQAAENRRGAANAAAVIRALRDAHETLTDALSNEWPANWWRQMMTDVNARNCKWPGLRNEVRDWIQAYANRPSEKANSVGPQCNCQGEECHGIAAASAHGHVCRKEQW